MLIEHNDLIGLSKYYYQEKAILDKLKVLQNVSSDIVLRFPDAYKQLPFPLTNEQYNALFALENNNVVIITGSAGTGKTLIQSAIVESFRGYSISLCALSAKAAQRMKELTGEDAYTIHKTLEFSKSGFKYNAKNPLSYKIYIMDEGSMVNCTVFKHYLDALPEGCKLIIIGDYKQLPPIGPGNVFKDLLGKNFPVYRFNKIHRQEADSGIIQDSFVIKDKKNPVYSYPNNKWIINGKLQDMFYYFTDDRMHIQRMLLKSFIRGVVKYGMDEVVMLLPTKERGLNCTRELNRMISDHYIKGNVPKIYRNDCIFKLGDKIIQRENDYKGKGVLNGEIGYITEITESTYTVKFGDKIVEYRKEEAREIELAYALTVHLAQGAQYKMAITGIDNTHFKLLSNQLIYTAMTRATTESIIIAEKNAFNIGVHTSLNERETYLKYLS